MFNNLINIITAPKEVFVSLKDKPTVLFPLLLIIILAASVQYGYFHFVDRDFLIDQLVEQARSVFSGAPASQIRERIENRSTNAMAIQSMVGTMIFIPLIMLIYAGYLSLVSKFTYDEISFKQWFSLTCWTGIPAVFGALAGWVVLLSSSDGMITLQQVRPLSLNNLIFQTEGSFRSLLSNTDLTQFWSLVLVVLGYMQWTGKSAVKSALIAIAPYLVIVGIVVAVIVAR